LGTALTGYKIGVMWDDTVTQRYMFAWRADSDDSGAAWNIETVYGNGVGGCPTLINQYWRNEFSAL
jgi:hypothetical protein